MGKSQKPSAGIKISAANNPDLEEIRKYLASKDENGNLRRIKVRLISESMSPLLPTGAFAEVEACALDDLQFLDLVVFNYRSMLTCHCFFGHNEFKTPSGERTFITRGLASKYFDNAVAESQFVGRVATHRLSSSKYALYRFFNRTLGHKLTRKIFYRES